MRRRLAYGSSSFVVVLSAATLVSLLALPGASARNRRTPRGAGKMAFEVASVKANKSGNQVRPTSNFPLNSSDVYPPNGGLLSATNYPVIVFINFAYKLDLGQATALISKLPDWAKQDRFDIHARADGSPTKDQMRLMMQSLLASRFKLAVRKETQEQPVYDLVLEKPGKLGPQIMMRPANAPCSGVVSVAFPDSVPASFAAYIKDLLPIPCGVVRGSVPSERPGATSWIEGRDFTARLLAGALTSPTTGLTRSVIDQTGISGRFDFILYWVPQPSVDAQPDLSAPPFADALKNQLGLKLVPSTGPVDTFVIDHIEEPTPN